MTTAIAETETESSELDVEPRNDLVYIDDRLVRMIRDDHTMSVILRELVDDQGLPAQDAITGMGENIGVVVEADSPDPRFLPTPKYTGWAKQGKHRVCLERTAGHYFRTRS